jgi:FkbM family methyltransferase
MAGTGAAQLDPERVIEAPTIVGQLWLERSGENVTRCLLDEGIWDLPISGLMENVLEPGMTFVDVGANIGYFSVLGSRLVGPGGRVFAIEPDEFNLSLLRANLERHDCSNVTVIPVAAWSERAELDFHRPPDGAVARVGQDDGSGLHVPAAPLDELVEGPVDYLKVDCEHSDHVVVRGAAQVLERNPSMLLSVEFHPWEGSHLGESPAAILEGYRAAGLRPYEIVHRGIRPASWAEIANPELPEGNISFDFVMSRAAPEELKARGLIARKSLLERPGIDRAKQRLLRAGGDLLGRIPEPIRPRIRYRDRRKRDSG